ncbi:hypothetical protein DAPPUDRAFT_270219 [Daphnia pulex]|uniref:FZ domain-containing protein n=1 Tax=Daphnia pulex TaxID=6669 RepID=E9I0C7_DAPPU|nr:hypothetical protein DAPPUDRAFT_270219 [Daphnia pulex]|eukprot:EFX62555.1 hypothetical protein DAPPUDRAFT_270219 [Daphnia pulex]
MLFLTVAFFFSTISLSGGIYPDEKCFQAAKNSICFKYYPLQFKNCVATLSPYYDKIKLDICQSDEYPDHCVDVVAVCMDYREALVYAPGYPSDQEYEVLPTKYYYWGLALLASAGVFFILHVLFSVWLKRRGSSQGGAENNERPIIRTQPRGVEPPPSYETLVPRQSRWRTLHHMCSCGCNNSEEDRELILENENFSNIKCIMSPFYSVLNQFAPSAPSAPVDESLQNRAPLPPPRTRRRRQVPADQQLPAEQQLPADQLPADQQLADQQLADQQVADQQVANKLTNKLLTNHFHLQILLLQTHDFNLESSTLLHLLLPQMIQNKIPKTKMNAIPKTKTDPFFPIDIDCKFYNNEADNPASNNENN